MPTMAIQGSQKGQTKGNIRIINKNNKNIYSVTREVILLSSSRDLRAM